MQPPKSKYYFSKSCPFSHRISIVLLELFNEIQLQNFEFIEIDLLKIPEWFKNINPLGRLPVIQYGDKIMLESLSSCEYLLTVHPNHSLVPTDPFELYKIKAFIERFMASTCLYFYKLLRDQDKEQIDTTSALLLKSLLQVTLLISSAK